MNDMNDVLAQVAHDRECDWTIGPEGRANSSELYIKLSEEVARLIREGGGWALDQEWTYAKAWLIMAQLAHVHHLSPPGWCYEE